MQRTTYDSLGVPGFVIDQASVALGQGRLVAFAELGTADYGAAGKRVVPAGTIMSIRPDGSMRPRAVTDTASLDIDTDEATITLEAHGLAVGDTFVITDTALAGTYTVTAVPTDDTFTADITAGDQTGTAVEITTPAMVILLSSADEASRSDAVTGYGNYRGGGFYANMLPENGETGFAAWVAELGARFWFETLENDLLS